MQRESYLRELTGIYPWLNDFLPWRLVGDQAFNILHRLLSCMSLAFQWTVW
jgi:hypothetical protein